MNKGEYISVETTTINDSFGKVIYRIEETGRVCTECSDKDGIKAMMLGGSGPSARKGHVVTDCAKKIKREINEKRTEIISSSRAEELEKYYGAKEAKPASGVIEI